MSAVTSETMGSVSTETSAGTNTFAASAKKLDTPETGAGQRSQPITPIKVNNLESLLANIHHADSSFLVEGFRNGFSIPSKLDLPPISDIKNHSSSLSNPSIVSAKILQEVKLNRVSGPFDNPPLNNLILSPLGLVPKKAEGQFRLIHDLSYPKHNSVNSNIDPFDSSVAYETLDTCVEILYDLGPNSLISKTDIKDAFRIMPIHVDSHHLLGFTWKHKFYYDKCLPMGCSISCNLFERFSTAIQDILVHRYEVPYISHILDDFIFFGPPDSPICQESLQKFISLSDHVGIPIKQEKTVKPSQVVTLHGIEVDTSIMQMRLPEDKLSDLRTLLSSTSKCKKITLRNLQSLIGKLSFACRAVLPGRAFLRRLIDLTRGVRKPHFKIRLTRGARADLTMWMSFLNDFNGRVLITPNIWESAQTLKLFSDASGTSCAGICGSAWFTVVFPESWSNTNIVTKELLPILLLVKSFCSILKNKKILFFCDNIAVVAILNASTTKDPVTMPLVRDFVLTCLTNNILLRAKHIPGRHNLIPDMLSRSQISKALQLAPWLDRAPTPIPNHFLPWHA